MLQDDGIGWDPIHIWTPAPIVTQIYVLFILVVLIVAFVKLAEVWSGAPPFRLSRQAGNAQYLSRLEMSQISLRQWMICTLIVSAFALSANLTQLCDRLLISNAFNTGAIVYAIRGLSVIVSSTLVPVFLLFLIQWYVRCRAEYLRGLLTPPQPPAPSEQRIQS